MYSELELYFSCHFSRTFSWYNVKHCWQFTKCLPNSWLQVWTPLYKCTQLPFPRPSCAEPNNAPPIRIADFLKCRLCLFFSQWRPSQPRPRNPLNWIVSQSIIPSQRWAYLLLFCLYRVSTKFFLLKALKYHTLTLLRIIVFTFLLVVRKDNDILGGQWRHIFYYSFITSWA